MEVRSHIKFARISPIKARFLLGGLKKMKPTVAVERLALSKQRSARILRQAIMSAIANAKNNLQLSEDSLQFSTLRVDEGPFLKRFRAGSKGTGKPYVRRTSHIEVVLVSNVVVNTQAKKVVAGETVAQTKESTKKSVQVPQAAVPSLKDVKSTSKSVKTKNVTNEKATQAKRRTVVSK